MPSVSKGTPLRVHLLKNPSNRWVKNHKAWRVDSWHVTSYGGPQIRLPNYIQRIKRGPIGGGGGVEIIKYFCTNIFFLPEAYPFLSLIRIFLIRKCFIDIYVYPRHTTWRSHGEPTATSSVIVFGRFSFNFFLFIDISIRFFKENWIL